MRPRKIEKRRMVDFLALDEDHECALLGALGFSTSCIQGRTGLSDGQITYRLRKAEIRRIDFRNGTSPWAKLMMRNMRDVTEPKLTEYLRRYSPPPPQRSTGRL